MADIVDCSTGEVLRGQPDPPGWVAAQAQFTAAVNAAEAQRQADIASILADKTLNPALVRHLGISAESAITPGM